jgi:hypothetical protein
MLQVSIHIMYIWTNINLDLLLFLYRGLQVFQQGAVPGTFICLKWSLVPPHFKVLYKIFMKSVQIFNKKVLPVSTGTIEKYWKPWAYKGIFLRVQTMICSGEFCNSSLFYFPIFYMLNNIISHCKYLKIIKKNQSLKLLIKLHYDCHFFLLL